jgi:hypothetical protein
MTHRADAAGVLRIVAREVTPYAKTLRGSSRAWVSC